MDGPDGIEMVPVVPTIKVAPASGLVQEALTLAKAAGKKETGGLLLGTVHAGPLDEIQCHPTVLLHAKDGTGTAVRFEMSPQIQDRLVSKGREDHPDLRVVGWWHSHPGHGIFYSPWDEASHRTFFGRPGLVGLVVDPTTGEKGWFGVRKEGGAIEAIEEAPVTGGASGRPDGPLADRLGALESGLAGARRGGVGLLLLLLSEAPVSAEDVVGLLLLIVALAIWNPFARGEAAPGPAEVADPVSLLSEAPVAEEEEEPIPALPTVPAVPDPSLRLDVLEAGLRELGALVAAGEAAAKEGAEEVAGLGALAERVEGLSRRLEEIAVSSPPPEPVLPLPDPVPEEEERLEELEGRVTSAEELARLLAGALDGERRQESGELAFLLWNRFNFSGLRPGCERFPASVEAGENFLALARTYMENNHIKGERRKVALALFRHNAATFIRADPMEAVVGQGWPEWLVGARFYAVEPQFAIFNSFPPGYLPTVPFRVVAGGRMSPCILAGW
ncbi:Mov34/MPN/PAD-1 family protein [bacterium]|nr:Mov34/MPN/PAD-1 family protein [bacterium]